MATHFAFCKPMDGIAPTVAGNPSASAAITASGTNQQTTITAEAGNVCVVTSDEAVYVAFGLSPDATAEPRHRILAGTVRDFGSLQSGWKAAVVTA